MSSLVNFTPCLLSVELGCMLPINFFAQNDELDLTLSQKGHCLCQTFEDKIMGRNVNLDWLIFNTKRLFDI